VYSTAAVWKCCKFLAVHGVGVMTLHECHFDRPFPYHVIRCWVRTRLPLVIWAFGCPFKSTFCGLTLCTTKCCHMDLWSERLVLTHHPPHWIHPSLVHQRPESRVSNSFFLSVVLSSGGMHFALFPVKQRAAFQLSLSSKHIVRVVFLFGLMAPPFGCLNYCLTGVVVGQSLGP
jgi:hypothetical protein